LAELVDTKFCGRSISSITPQLVRRLAGVEANLTVTFDGLPESLRRTPQGTPARNVREWIGLTEGIVGFYQSSGKHGRGEAIDLEYSLNPYIVTRTGATLGGERGGADLLEIRRYAISACDRAMCWVHGRDATADLSASRRNETAERVWDRFSLVSQSLFSYFGLAFLAGEKTIFRKPLPQWGSGPVAHFEAIPTREKRSNTEALARIERSRRTDWQLGPEETLLQVLRDYEAVRIPMVRGVPTLRPERTRNPARGFLTLPRMLVVALRDFGKLRWGACDFGPAESGDIMHFDLG
jgi:hypothetical protein